MQRGAPTSTKADRSHPSPTHSLEVYGARGNLRGDITLVMLSLETLENFMYVGTNDQHHEFSWTLDHAADLLSS